MTAVVGTHTHVQTADERMLPEGTACLTDAGMTGPHDGVIGDGSAGRDRALPHRHAGPFRACRRATCACTACSSLPIRRPAAPTAIERLSISGAELEQRVEQQTVTTP